MAIKVSFVIATRNRPEVLQWCIRSCLAQVGIEPEILVYDDGSEPPVEKALCDAKLLSVISYRRFDLNQGYVVLRNQGYKEARGDYICSIDDDLVWINPHAVSLGQALLDSDPSIAVVAFRFFERPVRAQDLLPCRARGNGGWVDIQCRSFTGCAAMLRKEAVLRCGLYPDWIYRQGEERFLSIRLLDAGYRIVLHGPPAAIHLFSPVRDRRAMQWYGIRNTLLFDWICVPQPYLLPYLCKDLVKLFLYKISISRIPTKCGAIAWGLASILQKWSLRNPVSRATFRKYLSLPRHGPLPLPPEWSPEPLVKLGIIKDASELDPYLKPVH